MRVVTPRNAQEKQALHYRTKLNVSIRKQTVTGLSLLWLLGGDRKSEELGAPSVECNHGNTSGNLVIIYRKHTIRIWVSVYEFRGLRTLLLINTI